MVALGVELDDVLDPSVSQQIVEILSAHAQWAGPACFVLACAASCVGLNFLVPVGTILVAIGALVGGEVLSWSVVVWSACGAVCGSTISFVIGSWLGSKIVQSPFMSKHATSVRQAHRLFESYGIAAVVLGYFSGPLRALVALIAGVAGMRAFNFQVANITAAPVWAAVTVAQGAVIGAAFGKDHPLFLAIPLVAPVIVATLSLLVAFLWRLGRKASPGLPLGDDAPLSEAYQGQNGGQR